MNEKIKHDTKQPEHAYTQATRHANPFAPLSLRRELGVAEHV